MLLFELKNAFSIGTTISDYLYGEMKNDYYVGGKFIKSLNDYKQILLNGNEIGAISIENSDNGFIKISSIYITSQYRGNNRGKEFLKWFSNRGNFFAFDNPSNVSSLRMFLAAGFKNEYSRTINGEKYFILIK